MDARSTTRLKIAHEPRAILTSPADATDHAMVSSLFVAVLGLGFAALGSSSEAANCSATPSWTIKDLNIKSRDEVSAAGRAVFSFTDNVTNKTDSLSCTLIANYRCQFDGTPSDPTITINIQAMMEVMYISVTQKLTCGSTTLVYHEADDAEQQRINEARQKIYRRERRSRNELHLDTPRRDDVLTGVRNNSWRRACDGGVRSAARRAW